MRAAKESDLRAAARLLARLRGARFAGGLIARAVWRREDAAEGLSVLRDRRDTVVACARVRGASLTVTMLLGRAAPFGTTTVLADGAEKRPLSVRGGVWHTFTAAEIAAFVEAVGDTNAIHQGEWPVVPGLLLLERVLQGAAFSDARTLSLRFLRPAFAREPLALDMAGVGRFTIAGVSARVEGSCDGD